MRRLTVFLCSMIFVAGLLPLSAHKLPVVVTTIERLEDGQLGITHRMHLHDAVQILSLDPAKTSANIETVENKARVALYVDSRFALGWKGDTAAPQEFDLELLGAEIDGDYVFVYQQMPYPDGQRELWVRSGLLKEIGDDWLSHINVETGETIRSITFTGKTRWKQVDL